MALALSHAVALVGLDGHVIEVEADLGEGIPGLSITGLPDAALNEARDRVRAAVTNSGYPWPSNRKVLLGLSPASLPKRGSSFDLALAAALLAAGGVVPAGSLRGLLLLGELGLDGRVRGVPGVLPSVLAWVGAGHTRVVVPASNVAEARLLPEAQVVGVASLRSLVDLLRGEGTGDPDPEPSSPQALAELPGDFVEVAGQPQGRLACEVAAAGGHNLLMVGPPGCGKTLLAERIPGVLPALSLAEALDVTAIHSVAGVLPGGQPLVEAPPFQSPHHTATAASIVGGGSGLAKPGAASLAHRGVLFLDEAPEFKRGVLDALRQPLESGRISIRRVGGTASYPARFSLVLAANPCPCAKPDNRCSCSPDAKRTYLARISGPMLDRIDINVALPAITRREILSENGIGEASTAIAARVVGARARAAERYAGTPWRTNADVPHRALLERWPVPRAALVVVGKAVDLGLLTGRGFDRVQRLAWTLADLEGRPVPTKDDVDLALSLRLGDLWDVARGAA